MAKGEGVAVHALKSRPYWRAARMGWSGARADAKVPKAAPFFKVGVSSVSWASVRDSIAESCQKRESG